MKKITHVDVILPVIVPAVVCRHVIIVTGLLYNMASPDAAVTVNDGLAGVHVLEHRLQAEILITNARTLILCKLMETPYFSIDSKDRIKVSYLATKLSTATVALIIFHKLIQSIPVPVLYR